MLARFSAGLINFFAGIVELFLLMRVLFRFFGANPNSSFVHWVYNSSDVLLQPFRGIFPTQTIGRNHVVDFSALFAMVVYAIFTALVISLLLWLSPARATAEPVVTKKKLV